MANVGGRAGIVNQDRLTGLRGRLTHKAPELTKIITHVSASTGFHRTARSYTPLIGWVPDTGANAVYGSILTTLQKFGVGSAKLSYTITGRRAGGKGFKLHRSDFIASQFDIAFDTADLEFGTLYRLAFNPFRHIRIYKVASTVHVTDKLRQWQVRGLQARRNGRWQKAGTVNAPPGSTVHLRAKLLEVNQIRPIRYVRFTVQAPQHGSRFVRVIGGGEFFFFGGGGAGSFNGVLRQIRHEPRQASLIIERGFGGKRGGATHGRAIRLHRSTIGGASARIRAVPAT
jgi:hypothetical protein